MKIERQTFLNIKSLHDAGNKKMAEVRLLQQGMKRAKVTKLLNRWGEVDIRCDLVWDKNSYRKAAKEWNKITKVPVGFTLPLVPYKVGDGFYMVHKSILEKCWQQSEHDPNIKIRVPLKNDLFLNKSCCKADGKGFSKTDVYFDPCEWGYD